MAPAHRFRADDADEEREMLIKRILIFVPGDESIYDIRATLWSTNSSPFWSGF
jgi:hypothetical protein